MFIFFVSYMSPRGLGAADAYHLYSAPIPEVIVVAVPPPKKDLAGGEFLYRPVLSPQGTDIATIRQVLSDFISARHSRHATSAPIKDWFSAFRQANAPFGQILNALAIGSLIAPIYYISNPLITTSYISLVTNNELLYVPKGTAYPSLGGEFAQPKTTSQQDNSVAVAFGKGGYKKHLTLESKMNKFTIARWSWSESNREPSACNADALPIELQPLFLHLTVLASVVIWSQFPTGDCIHYHNDTHRPF